ncbi:MAG: aminotransferase class I/II-fold pyridoxal phosphate-dependent enzyme [Eubacteriales bacterium]|nr:aminotransferase class I/II-fold pyridoxal phosphate-dependent enzyme [Eubacteriales bacterium]
METICFTQDEKLYIQIFEYFVNEIEGKRIHSGDKLPSMRKLADHLGVSLNTVKTAYEMLLDEGYIVSRERSGYYVDKILSENLPNLAGEIENFLPPPEKCYKYNFKYSLTDNSRIPVSVIKKCAQAAVSQSIEVVDYPNEGIWELRYVIAKYLKERRGVITSPENIVVTSGFEDNLFILSSLLQKPVFALESPGYTRLSYSLDSLRQDYIYVPIDQYGFSVKDLEKTTANVVITSPNHQFPTGLITGIRRRQRLLNWAKDDERRYIVEDDYNSDFKYTGRPIPALKSMDETGSVILSGSFSQSVGKFLGISYLVLPDRLIMGENRLHTPLRPVSPPLEQSDPQLPLQPVSPLSRSRATEPLEHHCAQLPFQPVSPPLEQSDPQLPLQPVYPLSRSRATESLEHYCAQFPFQPVSPLLQYTLKEFLARGNFEKHLNRMNTLYSRKRRKFLKAVKQEENVEVYGSDAGLHIIVELDPAHFDLEHFEEVMAEHAIYAERVKNYAQGPWPDNEIILGFGGIKEDRIEEAVGYFFKILRKP